MMRNVTASLNRAVTAFFLLMHCGPAQAQSAGQDLDALLERLAIPELAEWESVERQIARIWSQSGSPAMDLLLRRGREAMEADDYETAIEHFSALIDHAPDFADGWNARATAFFANGQYGLALVDVQRTLVLEPRHFAALQGLGLIMRDIGEFDLARRAFERAASIHPNDPEIRQMLNRLEAESGDVDI